MSSFCAGGPVFHLVVGPFEGFDDGFFPESDSAGMPVFTSENIKRGRPVSAGLRLLTRPCIRSLSCARSEHARLQCARSEHARPYHPRSPYARSPYARPPYARPLEFESAPTRPEHPRNPAQSLIDLVVVVT